jgi:hypothetical protein
MGLIQGVALAVEDSAGEFEVVATFGTAAAVCAQADLIRTWRCKPFEGYCESSSDLEPNRLILTTLEADG